MKLGAVVVVIVW